MNRRVAGLLLIAVALLVAAAVPALRPRTTAGISVAAPVAGPPVVGDCMTEPIYQEIPTVRPQSELSDYRYPQLATQRCSGDRYGEVVSVLDQPARPKRVAVTDGSGSYLFDPNPEVCGIAVAQYVGIDVDGTSQTQMYALWFPALLTGSTLSGPSARQTAAGQHWLACVVNLLPSGSDQQVPETSRYAGSLSHALLTGNARDQLGFCSTETDPRSFGAEPGACSRPHQVESFGFGSVGVHAESRAELERTCRLVVQQLTRIPHLAGTAGLTVHLHAVDANTGAPTNSAQVPARSNLICGVGTAGTKKLKGSLLALGSQPIPWA